MPIKKLLKELIKWIAAFIIAAFVLNLLTFSFYHPVIELHRNGGATPGLMIPHQWGLLGNEGYGIQTTDSRGYVNPDLPLASDYYCVVGASHTEGFHSRKGERFTDYLNAKFGYTDSLGFYNIAHTAYQFDEIAMQFPGIVAEFPDMKGLILELDSTDYSLEQLENSLNQTGYSKDEDSIEALLSRQTTKDKIVNFVKSSFPILRELSFQYETYKTFKKSSGTSESDADSSTFDAPAYTAALSQVMDLIRSEYSGPIIIVFHPDTILHTDGSIEIQELPTDKPFEEECKKHDIAFIDLSDRFYASYYEDNTLPTGFWNTTMNSGHINKYGHQIIADALYEYLISEGIN